MLNDWGYRHTLRICDTSCFSATTMVTRTRLIVTLYVLCLSCCFPSTTEIVCVGRSYCHPPLLFFYVIDPEVCKWLPSSDFGCSMLLPGEIKLLKSPDSGLIWFVINQSIHWHEQNAVIPCRSQEPPPFLPIIHFFLPLLSANHSSILPHFIKPSISWSASWSYCFQIHIQYSFGNPVFFHSMYMSKPT